MMYDRHMLGKKKTLIGQHAFLRDLCCGPKQVGGCTIIALSKKGPEYVIVEWSEDGWYHSDGDVSCVKLSELDIR